MTCACAIICEIKSKFFKPAIVNLIKSSQPFKRLSMDFKSSEARTLTATLELLNDPAQSGTSVAKGRNINGAYSGQKTSLDSIHLLKMLSKRHQELVSQTCMAQA